MCVCLSVCVCVRRKLYVFHAFHAFLSSFSCVGWFGHKCLITCTDKFGEACVKGEIEVGRCVEMRKWKMEKRKKIKDARGRLRVSHFWLESVA